MSWMSMFRTITTDWIYNTNPLLHTKQRFVGPAWAGRLILYTEGKHVHPLLQRLAAFAFKRSGAHLETQDLTQSEIYARQLGLEFAENLDRLVQAGHRVGAGLKFVGLKGIIDTGPDLEFTDFHKFHTNVDANA